MQVTKELLERLTGPFFAQGEERVYIAIGCNRIYIAPIPSTKCKRCDGVHENVEVTSLKDLDNFPLTSS